MIREHILASAPPPITYQTFANEVNASYPNRLKHLHHNFSVNQDGLFYVTVEQGTTLGQTKTLVVGNENGILTTKDVGVSGWGGYVKGTCFSYHKKFGFYGRTTNSSGRDTYLSVFSYNSETNSITNIQTSTSVNVKNWCSENVSCFSFQGVDYAQFSTNATYLTLCFYNLTTCPNSVIRNEFSGQSFYGATLSSDSSYFYYIRSGVSGTASQDRKPTSICESSTINVANSSTRISNEIPFSTFGTHGQTYQRFPIINGVDKVAFNANSVFYQSIFSSDYTTLSYSQINSVETLFPNYYYWNAIVFELNQFNTYDAYYVNSSNYNIVKLQNALNFS